jgi:hypothetical protein
MRLNITREWIVQHWLPSNAVKITDKASDAVAYIYTKANAPHAAMFYGKQAKPVWQYRFKSEERRETAIREGFQARQQHNAMVKGWRDERKQPHGHKVGDVFVTCWGYDQTNREHYEIVELHGATMATVREIAQHRETTAWEQGKCSPDFGNFIGKPLRVKITKAGFSVDGHHASKVKVTDIGGVKVGEASHWTSYA